MAKFDKDSFGGTMLVVLILSLLCSVIVAGAVVSLKPIQADKKLTDKQRNILMAAGIKAEGEQVKTLFAERIEPRIVDLASGEYVEGMEGFDARLAAKDPAQSVKIAPEDDVAVIGTRAKYAEVYLVKGDDGKVNQIVLPMHGSGLWSVMYGFVSVQPDGNTINGITYYEQGETAGLGGEIANPLFQARFVGKKLYDEQGKVAIRVGKGASADQVHGVDGLSGATMTTKGVQASFNYWFSQNGFGPYLAKVRAGE